MPFTVVVRTVLFCSGKCEIISVWFQATDPWFVVDVVDGVDDLVDGELERSEVLFQLEGLERTQ